MRAQESSKLRRTTNHTIGLVVLGLNVNGGRFIGLVPGLKARCPVVSAKYSVSVQLQAEGGTIRRSSSMLEKRPSSERLRNLTAQEIWYVPISLKGTVVSHMRRLSIGWVVKSLVVLYAVLSDFTPVRRISEPRLAHGYRS
jgi:hypothetical protein